MPIDQANAPSLVEIRSKTRHEVAQAPSGGSTVGTDDPPVSPDGRVQRHSPRPVAPGEHDRLSLSGENGRSSPSNSCIDGQVEEIRADPNERILQAEHNMVSDVMGTDLVASRLHPGPQPEDLRSKDTSETAIRENTSEPTASDQQVMISTTSPALQGTSTPLDTVSADNQGNESPISALPQHISNGSIAVLESGSDLEREVHSDI